LSGGPHLTDWGLGGIHWVPYGLHVCHFYADREELTEALVTYFLAGLYLGEKCLWITAPPLPSTEARELLHAAWPRSEQALTTGALSIVEFADWYGGHGGHGGIGLAEALLREEEQALQQGYRGLRLAENVAGLAPDERIGFHEFETLASPRMTDRRILALCSYERRALDAGEIRAVESAHHCTLEATGDDGWRLRGAEAAVLVRS
jgi:hypothetical protein